MGTPEPLGVFEVSYEPRDPLLRHNVREQGPEGSDGLDVRERSAGELVVVEGGHFVPQAFVYRQGEPVTLFAQVCDLIQAVESAGHLQE